MNQFSILNAKKNAVKLRGFLLLLLLLSLCVAMSGCVREQVNYDFDTYFTDNSAFVVDAAKVLPSRELLQSENVVEYMYYDCDTLILGDDISDVIRLTIAYTDEEYLSEKERLEQLYLQSFPSSRCTQFNYNGVIYDGFEFFGENKKATCGLAYHICAESKTIIYFAFFTMEMSFMSVNDAIKYSIGSKYESEFACCPSVPESN